MTATFPTLFCFILYRIIKIFYGIQVESVNHKQHLL